MKGKSLIGVLRRYPYAKGCRSQRGGGDPSGY